MLPRHTRRTFLASCCLAPLARSWSDARPVGAEPKGVHIGDPIDTVLNELGAPAGENGAFMWFDPVEGDNAEILVRVDNDVVTYIEESYEQVGHQIEVDSETLGTSALLPYDASQLARLPIALAGFGPGWEMTFYRSPRYGEAAGTQGGVVVCDWLDHSSVQPFYDRMSLAGEVPEILSVEPTSTGPSIFDDMAAWTEAYGQGTISQFLMNLKDNPFGVGGAGVGSNSMTWHDDDGISLNEAYAGIATMIPADAVLAYSLLIPPTPLREGSIRMYLWQLGVRWGQVAIFSAGEEGDSPVVRVASSATP